MPLEMRSDLTPGSNVKGADTPRGKQANPKFLEVEKTWGILSLPMLHDILHDILQILLAVH